MAVTRESPEAIRQIQFREYLLGKVVICGQPLLEPLLMAMQSVLANTLLPAEMK
jgi:hypothetical protein